jgi:hypothetical protein
MASSADPPPADPAAERQPLVELKNSKVVFFKQKPLALEKLSETMKGAWHCVLQRVNDLPPRDRRLSRDAQSGCHPFARITFTTPPSHR